MTRIPTCYGVQAWNESPARLWLDDDASPAPSAVLQEEVKRARDIANFNLKASFKNGLVGNAVRDAVQLNTLNMQRAVNR